MRIIDSHFHWWPRSVFEVLCKRKDFPRAEPNPASGGYEFLAARSSDEPFLGAWAEWFDLDDQLAHMDSSATRSTSSARSARSRSPSPICRRPRAAKPRMLWNEEMAGAQRKHPGRVWASAAVPLVDTQTAIDVVDHAVNKLGLMGVNLPGSVGDDPRIDAERLEPFYDRVEELGVPLFLHPTDARLPGHAGRRLWRRAVPEPRPRHRGERRGDAAGLLRHHGAPPEPQSRHVAYRRRAALSGGPHGQERQGGEAAAAARAPTSSACTPTRCRRTRRA